MVDADFIAVRVSTFRGDIKIPFNAYVRVAGKYILFCREGDSFEGDRLERLKTKKLQYMYVEKKNAEIYHDYINSSLEKAYDTSTTYSTDLRTQVIHGTLQAAADDLMDDPASSSFYTVALDGAERFVQFFYSDPKVLNSLLKIKNLDYSVSHHGVVTAGIALAILEELGINILRKSELNGFVVGCMIHDIDHRYNNINLSVEAENLTQTEKKIYANHAVAGARRIKAHQFYKPEIIDLVANHEETIDGSGPRKLKEKQIDQMCLALGVANQFDYYIVYRNLSPKEALKLLLIDKMGLLSLDAMRALQSALKKRDLM